MNIFITGIAGFLGSNLAHSLSKQNHNVFGNDNFIGGYEDNLSEKFKFYHVDCCNFKEMNKILDNIDILIHCAATAYEGLSCFSPYLITKNVYQNSVAVFTAAIINKAKRIVYCSSMARYGNNQTPFNENQTANPVDPYGIAKVAAEETLKTLCEIHKIEYCIAVPHNIIGIKPNNRTAFNASRIPGTPSSGPGESAISASMERLLWFC